jgi:hypothetical protein
MIKQQILYQLNAIKANILPYYFEYNSIPNSIQKYINITRIMKENEYNITIELYDIVRQKSNGNLYGVCREIAENIKNNNHYNYIFCAPTICSILICLFRFNNIRIIIFPYLSLTKVKYNAKQLQKIISNIINVFKLNIQIDLSFMEDYIEDNNNIIVFSKKYNYKNMYMYLYNVIKNIINPNVLCVMEEQYNDYKTNINIMKHIRNINMQLCKYSNQTIIINLQKIYNLPIIHQIIDNYQNIH